MNDTYHITVNDSPLGTRDGRAVYALILIGCFVVQFLLYSLLDYAGVIRGGWMEDSMPGIALVVSVLVLCVYSCVRDQRTHGTMKLEISFGETEFRITVREKTAQIPYTAVAEVRKWMVVDRFHSEKGCYRVRILCHGRSDLTFETTQEEYEAQADFEQTGLAVFYRACQEAGLKCC